MLNIRFLCIGAIAVASAFGANQAIGTAVANGSFQIDKSSVYGNTTLFDGSLIETGVVSSDLALRGGTRLRLGAQSQARVHPDRLVLDKGQTEISASAGYSVEALGLRVAPDSPQSRLAVTYSGTSRIEVAALAGSARISGLDGALIAKVAAGTALDLEPKASGAASPSKLTGILESKNGAFLLTDETTRVTYALVGTGLGQYIGKRVEVSGTINTGAPTAAGSPQSIQVLEIGEIAKAGKRGGVLHSKAVIAGVAVAAAGGTVAAIAATSGSPKSTISAQ